MNWSGTFDSVRLSGILLVAGLGFGLVALGVLAASGALPAFSAALRRGALAEMAPHVVAFRVSNILYAAAWASLMAGFTLLYRLLSNSDAQQFSTLGLVALAVATSLGLLEATFGISVTPWAAEQAASSGTIPPAYEVVDRWVGGIQAVYIFLGLAAQAGFGAALIQTDILPAWVGQTTLVWSLVWLVVIGLGIPAILFIMPAVIGAALLFV